MIREETISVRELQAKASKLTQEVDRKPTKIYRVVRYTKPIAFLISYQMGEQLVKKDFASRKLPPAEIKEMLENLAKVRLKVPPPQKLKRILAEKSNPFPK